LQPDANYDRITHERPQLVGYYTPALVHLLRHTSVTARSEVTDRMLIFGERHLRRTLDEYARHYNGRRPHRALQLQPPRSDRPVVDLTHERIRRRPVLGGLITEYERFA
jgi:transposase InsO family protein